MVYLHAFHSWGMNFAIQRDLGSFGSIVLCKKHLPVVHATLPWVIFYAPHDFGMHGAFKSFVIRQFLLMPLNRAYLPKESSLLENNKPPTLTSGFFFGIKIL